jgi:hypothetical protein
MRSPLILCTLALAVLGWTAPGHAAPQIKAEGLTVQREETPHEKYQDLKSPEVDWQVVAIRRKGVDICPTVDGWKSEKSWLFQTLRSPDYRDKPSNPESRETQDRQLEKELRRALAVEPILKDLDRFCSYRKTSNSSGDFPMHPLPAGLEKGASNSRAALVPAGELDTGASASILARHFLDQTAGMSPAQKAALAGPQRVRLVFVDTQQDGDGVPHVSGPSRHGYTLVHLAHQMACRDVTPCPVGFGTRLALHHANRDLPSASDFPAPGGNLGLVDELAEAIVREVWSWRQPGSPPHLILNLSVGWDEFSVDKDKRPVHELDSRKISRLRPDTQLVYKALQFARRSGALVIAAAGNRRGGMESKWPLLPAAWELRRPSWLPFALGPKPVYAVGGVGWQDLPLPNYRQGGMPRRVAFGDHAVAGSTDTYAPTAMYTGSSVSAAVVSAIAATAWQLRPKLRPAEVMELISRSGEKLPGRADYYAWKDLWPFSQWVKAPHLRRLSLCRAVQWACADGGRCAIPSCPSPSGPANLSVLIDPASIISPLPDLRAATLPADCRPASSPAPWLFAVDEPNASRACPLHLLPDIVSQRWVFPQPDDPPCPGCSLIPPSRTLVASLAPGDVAGTPRGYVLAIEIDPKWLSPEIVIDGTTLDIDRYSGGKFVERMTYAIPVSELLQAGGPTGSHLLLLKEAVNGASLAECTATLNFEVTMKDADGVAKTFSVQSPIYVDPESPL